MTLPILATSIIGPAILITVGLAFVVALGWVAADASRFEWNHGAWSVFGWVMLCRWVWIVGFPLYFVARRRRPLRTTGST